MANNKIQLGNGDVLLDLTGDTVRADKLARGYTAHDKSGAQITGKMDEGGGSNPIFEVTADLNLGTMQISNISESFSDALDAIANGQTVKLSLSYVSPFNRAESAMSFSSIVGPDYIDFCPLMVADLGYGLTPYVFFVAWSSTRMSITPYMLSTQGA